MRRELLPVIQESDPRVRQRAHDHLADYQQKIMDRAMDHQQDLRTAGTSVPGAGGGTGVPADDGSRAGTLAAMEPPLKTLVTSTSRWAKPSRTTRVTWTWVTSAASSRHSMIS